MCVHESIELFKLINICNYISYLTILSRRNRNLAASVIKTISNWGHFICRNSSKYSTHKVVEKESTIERNLQLKEHGWFGIGRRIIVLAAHLLRVVT